MAQYKVIQDVEADDKLIAWLSLRQFVYAVITIVSGFLAVRLFMTSVWFLGIIFLPPALFFGLLAAPLGGAQSTEIWLLAKIRFFLKPRRRIWDQTGIQQLVTITAPKKIEKQLTKGYSDDEVKSRLKTLATTLDTRGWAIKNATNTFVSPLNGESDRLLDISAATGPSNFVDPTTDIMDPDFNPRAKSMDSLISQASAKHKDAVMRNIEKAKHSRPTVHHENSTETNPLAYNMKVIDPLPPSNRSTAQKQSMQPVTPSADPAILDIVKNSDDLSVQTIAGQAKRVKDQGPDDEVVISLH